VESGLDKNALPQTRVHLCGAPAFVYAMRKRLFLKGLRSGHIHCDPFTEREVSGT
jgi:ferredoxin-NADP reductase